jgi:hypothetical protein
MQDPSLAAEFEIGQPPEGVSSIVQRSYPSATPLYMEVQFVVAKLHLI